ncbi:hypothetical protein M0811_04647 [Anaeramoeba ignava]|uniref:Uncharacterized protein n=1 Tax=Anaeramoeba ignava TaxID=1746090 RepID=A0A9Q0RGA3_ANAIG|nr:hypothetical protein M0811_04647 [Anaeramoeba ignava]
MGKCIFSLEKKENSKPTRKIRTQIPQEKNRTQTEQKILLKKKEIPNENMIGITNCQGENSRNYNSNKWKG